MIQEVLPKVKATINGLPVEVPQGTTILKAARELHINIPVLCKHKHLAPTAACGLCIVRLKGSPKMPRACATPVENGMDITTHDAELTDIRRGVIELILSNHPNECLSCGRNGNCELQSLAADFGIRCDSIPRYVPEIPCDNSNGSIVLDFRKCIKCGRCVQVCQEIQNVWALSFLHRGIHTRMAPAGDIALAESPCVKCGQCSAHCPTGAIVEVDETAKVWDALHDPQRYTAVQIAPSVRVAVGDAFGFPPGENLTGKIYAALRRLGFKAVFDTNFSADLTIMEEGSEFVERFAHGKGALPLITSCCPGWTDYMEKYHPDFVENFSSAKSPQQMLGAVAKTYYCEKAGIAPRDMYLVSIMPCTAKKWEIARDDNMSASGHKDVDVVLTTREFCRMIKQAGIDFANLEPEQPDSILAEYTGAATIFGVTGGVMEAAIRTAYHLVTGEDLEGKALDVVAVRGLDGVKEATISVSGTQVRVAVAHGLANVGRLLDKVRAAREAGGELPYHFIEVMACPSGCIGGGGQPYDMREGTRGGRIAGLYNEDASLPRRCSHHNPEIQRLYADFLGKPLGEKAHHLLHTSYQHRPVYQK